MSGRLCIPGHRRAVGLLAVGLRRALLLCLDCLCNETGGASSKVIKVSGVLTVTLVQNNRDKVCMYENSQWWTLAQ